MDPVEIYRMDENAVFALLFFAALGFGFAGYIITGAILGLVREFRRMVPIRIEARKLPLMFRYRRPLFEIDRFCGVATLSIGPYVISIWR